MNIKEFHEELEDRGVHNFFDAWVEPGWHPLVFELIEKLMEMGWDGSLAQIKEKFGTLRFYINNGNPEMYELIHKYENKTRSVCEYCGQPGDLVKSDWWKTLCSKHKEEHLARR